MKTICIFLLFLFTCASADPAPDSTGNNVTSVATTITQATGYAINPLLVISTAGAWQYYTAKRDQTPAPWNASPWVWGTGIALLLLFAFNTALGTLFPVIKTPMNILEQYEGKISLLVASPIVLKQIAALAQSLQASQTAFLASHPYQMAGFLPQLDPAGWFYFAFFALAIGLAFGAVWVTFQAIDVFILISPFGMVDIFLRVVRILFVILLAVALWIHPILGAIISMAIIVPCLFFAGWAFRWTVLGMVFSTDWLFFRNLDLSTPIVAIRAFWNDGVDRRIPKRTMGMLRKENDEVLFRYRPWLIFPSRTLTVSGNLDSVTQGILYPSITKTNSMGKPHGAFWLPPRFRSHESLVATILSVPHVRPGIILHGLRTAWSWLKGIFQDKSCNPC
jgi:hypothetical protein